MVGWVLEVGFLQDRASQFLQAPQGSSELNGGREEAGTPHDVGSKVTGNHSTIFVPEEGDDGGQRGAVWTKEQLDNFASKLGY